MTQANSIETKDYLTGLGYKELEPASDTIDTLYIDTEKEECWFMDKSEKSLKGIEDILKHKFGKDEELHLTTLKDIKKWLN